MNQRALLRTTMIAVFVLLPLKTTAQDTLTGDPKLACEAILCLASGSRPQECMPSLSRYFSISMRKFKDTLRARNNFLSLCPKADTGAVKRIIDKTTVDVEPQVPAGPVEQEPVSAPQSGEKIEAEIAR